MAPASPKQPRTFEGKKLISDACPKVPAILDLNFDISIIYFSKTEFFVVKVRFEFSIMTMIDDEKVHRIR